MPRREYGPTGVASPGPGLDQDAREHLSVIVTSKLCSLPDMEGLLDAVSLAVSGFYAASILHEEAKPAIVRKELDDALKAALKLNDRINDLGGTARQSVYDLGDGAGLVRLRDHVSGAINILSAAKLRAAELQSTGGRLPDLAAIKMAAQIAHAIRTFARTEPTSTRGGLFEEVLLVAMEAVRARGALRGPGDRPDPALHDLMLKALRAKVTEHPDGVIEIDPMVG